MGRVRITNNSVNSYGFRILTEGMDTKQYERNPVLLYMHERGDVIGYVKDLNTSGDELSGELVFDEASELSVRCKKQFEFGSLKMVSVGIDVLATSEADVDLVSGQIRPTVTKSKLFEVSLVDIGANDDAIVLKKDGKVINLSDGGECPLPYIVQKNKNKKQEMELKTLALQLGLAETATEGEVQAKLSALKSDADKAEALAKEKESLTLSAIEQAVETAVKDKRLSEDKKAQFIELGKQVGIDLLNQTLGAMNPQVKISTVLTHQGGAPASTPKQYTKLSEVPADELEVMRENDLSTYKKLYKAEYGIECEMKENKIKDSEK